MVTFDELRVRAEMKAGRAFEVWRLGEEALPLRAWPGVDGRLLAGSIAGRLGAPRLAIALHVTAWRRAPENLAAACSGLWATVQRLEPLVAWWRRGVIY